MAFTNNPNEVLEIRSRIFGFMIGASLIFVVLLVKLFYLQVVEGNALYERSEKNSIRQRIVTAPRGMIFDRNGAVLVDSRPSFDLLFLPREPLHKDVSLDRLSLLLGRDRARIEEAFLQGDRPSRFHPVRLLGDLSRDDLAKVETHKLDLPGMFVEVEPRRAYLYGS
ncbi:MAG: penicillin-binding protein 2, partial [Vicinamibacteria bacterium]